MSIDDFFRLAALAFAGLVILIFMFGLVLLLLTIVRAFLNSEQLQQTLWGSTKALTILKERYARGELSQEEYDRMRHTLIG